MSARLRVIYNSQVTMFAASSEQMTPGPPGPWLCYKALYRSLSGQYKCISFRSFHINQNLAAVVLAPREPHFTLHWPQVLLRPAQIIGETALPVNNQPCMLLSWSWISGFFMLEYGGQQPAFSRFSSIGIFTQSCQRSSQFIPQH